MQIFTVVMKKLLLATFAIVLCGTSAGWAQSDGTVKGKVLNEKGQPLVSASVAMYDSTQSEVVTGASSDKKGRFSIRVSPGQYVVKITFISYKNYTEQVTVGAGETVELGTVAMTPTSEQLGSVFVRAEESQMEMDFDKRVFNVGKDITSLGGSAVQVLNNVPSIATDIDGNISLRGNQSVRVLINGKPSSMVSGNVDALRSIPATMIKKVEIITNPSAEYAAEGSAGIINIVLKKKRERGINGSVSAEGGYPTEYGGSVNLNYRVNDINWFMDLGADYRSDPESGSAFQRFSGPDTTYMYREKTNAQEAELDGDLRFGADFYLSENEVLTASSYISMEREDNNEDVRYIDYRYEPGALDGQVQNRIFRENNEDNKERNFDFNLDYENKFNGDRHKLEADASFDLSNENAQTKIMRNAAPLQRSEDTELERDLRINAHYKRPLGEKGKLEVGLRTNAEWMDTGYSVDSLSSGNWVPQPAYSQNFLYTENINAAFLILGGEFGKFSGQVGVRFENTNIRTEIENTNNVNEQHYVNLFPSVSLNYSFNEQQSLKLSYSRRLQRPWSRSLIPFVDYGDPRSQFLGNPNLNPEFSNSYEFGYLQYWETGSLLTSFYYRHRTNVIEYISQQRNGVLYRFPINFASEKACGIEFSGDQELFDSLNLNANLNLFRSHTDGSYEDQFFKSAAKSLQGRMRLRWEILNGFNYQASMRYRGPSETPQGSREGMTMMDTGMSYDLLDGKAKLTFNVRDVFNSQHFNHTATTNGNPNTDFYSHQEFSWSSRSFSLNFQYFFGRDDQRGQRHGGGRHGDY